jgi:hypothetical protein
VSEPLAAPVELGQKLEPAAGAGVDVRGQGRQLVDELSEGEIGGIGAVRCCHI